MFCTALPSLAGPEARTEATTAANMRFAASVAIRSLRQTLRSVTAIAEKRNRRAFTAGSQTADR